MENKQLQQAKDTIAKKYGYLNFETIPYNHISSINVRYENYQDIVNEVSLEYHRLMSEWVLKQIESKQYQYIDILRKEVVNIHDVRNIFAENGIKLEPKF